ncbi:MAG: Alanine dehydrogenase [Parcubacteria group bacterium GW2011_GWA2_47_7]|nr:MAG: Alanine dehydrogenase [Parcubacteria group bacterium GW2011_GWA2_47_7]
MSACVVGVPKELKFQEGRVGLTPAGVRALTTLGAKVIVEQNAGVLSGFSDSAYGAAGAEVVEIPQVVWGNSDIVVKVKEPIASEYQHLLLLKNKTLFTYLHLAGGPIELTRALMSNEITAIAYETVSTLDEVGRPVFPLLVPMSKIAGTQAMRGALARFEPEYFSDLNAVIIGGGNVGEAALQRALGSNVRFISVFESWHQRECELREKYGSDKVKIFSFSLLNEDIGRKCLKMADIVICGPFLPGGKEAPIVLTGKHFGKLKKGCYISDVSIDQGGSTSWTKGHSTKPGETFTRGARNLVFSAVPNIPGSTVPIEATKALTEATLPYLLDMASEYLRSTAGDYRALREDGALRKGLQTYRGWITNEYVASHHGIMSEYKPLDYFFS